ncbi:MAG: FkbM family methyltransferase [Candidatus Dormibacteria bacterium]
MTRSQPPLTPRLAEFPEHARRIALTVSCRDADALAKVEGAGEMRQVEGSTVQVMHNGILVERDCYCGSWMTEIIRCLRGHHEPQEELVFSHLVGRLAATEPDASIVELGSWWAFYSLWFLAELPGGRAVAVEPDEAFLEVGKRNFALNGRTATFLHGAIGDDPSGTLRFRAESDGLDHSVPQYDLATLMAMAGLERVGLLLADIQGAETILIESARGLIEQGLIRFMLISTHHHSISGSSMTHQRTLATVEGLGGHVIAEHSVGESFSGDGLIAVSFDPRDRDLSVSISRARQKDSLFGELEPELELALSRASACEVELRQRAADSAALHHAVSRLDDEVAHLQGRLDAVHGSRIWRWSAAVRTARRRLREATGG